MRLTDRFKGEFRPGDRERGDVYFAADHVQIIDEGHDYISALVNGSSGARYSVEFDFGDIDRATVSASCECPRFADGVLCKHLWATIRALEQHHHFSRLNGDEQLLLIATEPDESLFEPDFKPPNGSRPVSYKRQHDADRIDLPARAERAGDATGWQQGLAHLQRTVGVSGAWGTSLQEQLEAEERQHYFVISVADQRCFRNLTILPYQSTRKRNGEWSVPVLRDLGKHEQQAIDDPLERRVFALLRSEMDGDRWNQLTPRRGAFHVPTELLPDVLPLLCDTGRFVWTLAAERILHAVHRVDWDNGAPWQLQLELELSRGEDGIAADRTLRLAPRLYRDSESIDIGQVVTATRDGLVLTHSGLARLQVGDASWVSALQQQGPLRFPAAELDHFLQQATRLPGFPPVTAPSGGPLQTVTGTATGQLQLSRQEFGAPHQLQAEVTFRYGQHDFRPGSSQMSYWDADGRRLVRRDLAAESKLVQDLTKYPFQSAHGFGPAAVQLLLRVKWLPQVVTELTAAGWRVVAQGKLMRSASAFHIEVTSGTDWFDLDARIEFDGVAASLPQLLEAVRKEQKYILLDDGSHGLLPEEWLRRCGRLAKMGQTEEDTVRFSKSQALLLDALLSEQDQVTVDCHFVRLTRNLKAFRGIVPGKEPRGFHGALRPYQRDGVGWLKFLRDFGFGGCLADDMGLGKTVQVLALLQSRRTRRLKLTESRRPSIVVVPKSLVFNWIDEAQRFAPRLRILDYTGLRRKEKLDQEFDVLVTTYGTLRRDILELKEIPFDYAILDESQAIKNAKSQAFKACRLLQAEHRLAMTGTPIENHLGELWSLFEFLNPGMLGQVSAFRELAGNDQQSLQWLGETLRPFILRRTKDQVLTDLPEKTEQTLYCEMTRQQQRLYDELREYYRAHIGQKIMQVGVKRAKIHVLEALLRLRQAACDPRLLDQKQSAPGAKLELLVEQLQEVLSEGHKALVFSQFTSLLALVREQFDRRKWTYEYLDGSTTKRAERVQRFQEDPACPLFLISLKAGGQGLNLTAADYVFILDPWWNPAVEAQAIDRAHRIGQTRRVMAYRLICQNTVEDKILQLQQTKRELADAIISANKSLISRLSLDDLQLLFG